MASRDWTAVPLPTSPSPLSHDLRCLMDHAHVCPYKLWHNLVILVLTNNSLLLGLKQTPTHTHISKRMYFGVVDRSIKNLKCKNNLHSLFSSLKIGLYKFWVPKKSDLSIATFRLHRSRTLSISCLYKLSMALLGCFHVGLADRLPSSAANYFFLVKMKPDIKLI